MIVVCRICHASPARGVFQTADGFGCIAPQYRCPWRAGAYRRDSPSSLWEGVSKFHYPPRCPRARFANTGSLYIDSLIYGYYSPVFVFGTLPVRLAICAGKGIVLALLLPTLLRVARHALQPRAN